MPIISAEAVEERALEAIFADVATYAPERFRSALQEEVERQRQDLLDALALLADELAELVSRRDAALDTVADQTLSPLIRAAMQERAESALQAIAAIETEQRTLRAGVQALDQQARSVVGMLTHPLVVPARWREPEVYQALRRALQVLVHRADLEPRGPLEYVVHLWLYNVAGVVGNRADALSPARFS